MEKSRIPKFYQYSVSDRLRILFDKKVLDGEDYYNMLNFNNILTADEADKMIENVIGVFGLPIGLGLNMMVNKKEYIIPMVVEEPSIVAAVSSASKLVRDAGGFVSESSPPLLIGQIQIMDVENPSHARNKIIQNKEEIINLANSLHPRMLARSGGVRDIEVRILTHSSRRGDMVIVHLLVDTKDAMGANLVNSMCEGVASLLEKISGGKVFLRILSNLTDRAIVKSAATIPADLLKGRGFSGEEVRDGIILANEFASIDPYRAATHNKGIMNGIDPVAIATGNDWRAIEAAAHAYAARGGTYTALTNYQKNEKGDLVATIEIPIKVGTVGGPLQSNPSVKILHNLMGIESARELAEVMGSVGLAQNMAALRALVTEGIQRGHMMLHARTVASAAGATADIFETVVEKLINEGEIKIWKAEEIVNSLLASGKVEELEHEVIEYLPEFATAYGKIILLGEHAVVYDSHAIAAPVPLAIQAKVCPGEDGVYLLIPRWGVEEKLQKGSQHKYSIYASLDLILTRFGLENEDMKIEILPHIPRAAGLGGSAALAVAIIRALAQYYKLDISNEDISKLAYESEVIAHGSASGIDNTLATYGQFTLYRKGDPPFMQDIHPDQPIPLVIGLTGVESLTAKMVAKVKEGREQNPALYNSIFDEINNLTLKAAKAIENYQLNKLGEYMNLNQGLLNALQVSSPELEEIIAIAKKNGALGAKLTGAGGGGAAIALCPEDPEKVSRAIRKAGYNTMVTRIG
ncbi:MAG: hydroxymethylglutaryl-CoA reductase, degradative [Calditrichaeota bacterium]|nr:hydroxymethylglutaryl-CoA reductase, degradative [Calditrichota bacterium]RQV93020.1 MAG: hydroxymethylglutaryl-CoA reductase, degradative [bacterium]RQW08229.1 MAG: hydroxymethylglutaryl-CoA reductase, degradative [Calditrichota bacterium]